MVWITSFSVWVFGRRLLCWADPRQAVQSWSKNRQCWWLLSSLPSLTPSLNITACAWPLLQAPGNTSCAPWQFSYNLSRLACHFHLHCVVLVMGSGWCQCSVLPVKLCARKFTWSIGGMIQKAKGKYLCKLLLFGFWTMLPSLDANKLCKFWLWDSAVIPQSQNCVSLSLNLIK